MGEQVEFAKVVAKKINAIEKEFADEFTILNTGTSPRQIELLSKTFMANANARYWVGNKIVAYYGRLLAKQKEIEKLIKGRYYFGDAKLLASSSVLQASLDQAKKMQFKLEHLSNCLKQDAKFVEQYNNGCYLHNFGRKASIAVFVLVSLACAAFIIYGCVAILPVAQSIGMAWVVGLYVAPCLLFSTIVAGGLCFVPEIQPVNLV